MTQINTLTAIDIPSAAGTRTPVLSENEIHAIQRIEANYRINGLFCDNPLIASLPDPLSAHRIRQLETLPMIRNEDLESSGLERMLLVQKIRRAFIHRKENIAVSNKLMTLLYSCPGIYRITKEILMYHKNIFHNSACPIQQGSRFIACSRRNAFAPISTQMRKTVPHSRIDTHLMRIPFVLHVNHPSGNRTHPIPLAENPQTL